MYNKIKNTLYTLLYLLLTSRFFLLIWDPAQSQIPIPAQDVFPLYNSARSAIDGVYWLSAYITYPFTLVCQAIPGIPADYFPYMKASLLADQWLPLAKNIGAFSQWTGKASYILMPGYVDWAVPIAMLIMGILSPLMDKGYETVRNLLWNVMIEFAYTKEKQQLYQEALRQRAEALMKLNVEYRNLSYEASQLKDSVVTDELTSLYNKRFFIENVKGEFESARDQQAKVALIMMDIDHFKKINDTYGHLVGDAVLKKVAAVAKNSTPARCYACRFGGEEFSVIMPAKNLQEAITVANTIRDNVPLLRFEEVPDLKCTISLGVCAVDFAAPEALKLQKFDDFVKLADDELYRAKLEGRDRVCHTSIEAM
ncbi:MAG: GGDEF domain-containing protein [Candidatus Melainabacteria bacterium]|nr:GGDEF domain-containing protein [Candidatus Melainabacteria bacterium]